MVRTTTQRALWFAAAVIGISLQLVVPASAQDEFETWTPVDDTLWTNDDNWTNGGEISGQPSIEFEVGALMGGGQMVIDDTVDTAGILQNGGAIEITSSGSLTSEKTEFQSGVTTFNGSLLVAAGGSLKGPNVRFGSNSSLSLPAPNSSVEATGDLNLGGILNLGISAAGAPNIKVGGAATVKGVISPTFDGVSPSFGDSWEFVSGASSVTVDAAVALPSTVTLGRGLAARVESDGGSASLTIGNLPILQIDRVSGNAKILNVAGDPLSITGYSIRSELGLLDKDGFTGTGAAGFDAPNPLATSIAEFSLQGEQTLPVNGDDGISIGTAYNGGAISPANEDVTFQFSTTAGILDGFVEYVGPANDLVLNVNPLTGEAALSNLSSHVGPIAVTGFTISSGSESLNAASFTGIGEEGWIAPNPLDGFLSDLNLESSKVFDNGTVVPLGNIFKIDGVRDIEIQYTTADSLLSATVVYGAIPTGGGSGPGCAPLNSLLGDLNGDGTVSFPDFLALSANFGQEVSSYSDGDVNCDGSVSFPDFLALSSNFGQSLGATAASVPEPNSTVLLGFGGILLFGRRRRNR